MSKELAQFAKWLGRKPREGPSEGLSDAYVREAFTPYHFERLEQADARGKVTGWCGDTMEIYLFLEGDTIASASFMTDGCGATMACGSILCRKLEGLSRDEARGLEPQHLRDALGGLPEGHDHCANLAILTLKEALAE